MNRVNKVQINNEMFNVRVSKESCDCKYSDNVGIKSSRSDVWKECESDSSDCSFIPPSMASLEEEDDDKD